MGHRYGSGTLFQRGKKGTWYAQIYIEGKQIGPFSTKTTDRKKAERELDKLLGKRARGEITGTSKDHLTVGDALNEYLAYADEKLQNARGIRWVVEAHLLEHPIAKLKVASLTTADLRRYRTERKASEATKNREISYLRAALRRALKEQRVTALPYFPVTKEENARQGFLEEPDFTLLLNELDPPLKPFACCAYYVGMRRGEMLRLQLSDVDLDAGFIEVRKTKNGDPRLVPIFDGPMREWLTWAYENRTTGQTKLFVWEDGRPFTERNFYARWHAACERANVKGFIPHDSRRSASRNMRNEGIPRPLRKKIIGHRTDAMDERYGIVDLEDAKAVREIMGRRFAKTTAKTTASNHD